MGYNTLYKIAHHQPPPSVGEDILLYLAMIKKWTSREQIGVNLQPAKFLYNADKRSDSLIQAIAPIKYSAYFILILEFIRNSIHLHMMIYINMEVNINLRIL